MLLKVRIFTERIPASAQDSVMHGLQTVIPSGGVGLFRFVLPVFEVPFSKTSILPSISDYKANFFYRCKPLACGGNFCVIT